MRAPDVLAVTARLLANVSRGAADESTLQLIESGHEARAALAEMMADVKQAHAALNQAATFPADIDLARTALNRALGRVGVTSEDQAPTDTPEQRKAREAQGANDGR